VISIVEGKLGKSKWLLGNDFTLVDCAYAPILNITEKAGFSYEEFPKVRAYIRTPSARVPLGKKHRSFRDFSRDPTVAGLDVDFGLCRTTI
jgi:glutathione S-transferase